MDQLRSLRVFIRVVADGSFAAAARSLDMAPSVVTRAVSELEGHLGVRLLQRNTRSLVLTEIGEDYLAHARRVVQALDDADAMASAANQEPSGVLRILCPPAFATHQLAAHLPEFHRRYPAIQLELTAAGPVEAADEAYDISIVSIGQQVLQGDFVVRPLASSAFVLCAAPAYLDRKGRPLQPVDLFVHNAMVPAVAGVRRELTLFRSDAAPAEGAPTLVRLEMPAPVLSTAQLEALYAAAVAGLGVTGLPTFMAAQALRDGRLELVLPGWHAGALQLYAAMPSRQHLPARTRALVDYLVQVFGGNTEDPWQALLP
jgi:DNA-binding transcriptional LysR family regulator